MGFRYKYLVEKYTENFKFTQGGAENRAPCEESRLTNYDLCILICSFISDIRNSQKKIFLILKRIIDYLAQQVVIMFSRLIFPLMFLFVSSFSAMGQIDTFLTTYSLESPELKRLVLSNTGQVLREGQELLLLDVADLSPADRISVMCVLAFTYTQTGQADSAKQLLGWLERPNADQFEYPQKMIALISQGEMLVRSNQCLEAYKVLHRAQEISRKYENVYYTEYINTAKGISLHLRGIEDQAFTYMRNGIQGLHDGGFEHQATQLENSLAALLIRSGYYEEAMDVLDHASHSSGVGISPDIATFLWLNKALAKLKTGRYDLNIILTEAQFGIDMARRSHFTIGQLLGATLKGEVLTELGRWEEAEQELLYVNAPIHQTILDNHNDLFAYSNIVSGKIYEHQKNWDQARSAYNWAIQHTIPGSRFPDYETGFQGLHRIALATSNRTKAAEVFNTLSQLKDSLFYHKNQAFYELIEARIELSRKEQQIKEAEQKLEIQTLSRQLLVGGLFLAALLSSVLFLVYRNRTIKRDKEKTERVNRQLERYTSELEELAFVVSHNLRESARNISTFTGLFSKSSAQKLSGKDLEYLKYMQVASVKTSDMLTDLEMYVGLGKNLPDSNPIQISQILQDLISNTYLADFKDHIHIDPIPPINAHPPIIRLLFQQLLDNAIKFRKTDVPVFIHISSEISKEALTIYVEDNGIGFNPSYQKKIMRVFQRLHQYTEIPGTGIGLAMVDKALKYYGGSVNVESAPDQGSKFSLIFPASLISKVKK